MFGYIRPHYDELRIREYRYYRGVYCGLCRAHGRCTGQCSRMTLSYDYVFFAMVRMALLGGNPDRDDPTKAKVAFERRRCLPHPFRRRLSLRAGAATDHAALCAALLNYHKICDDRADEKKGSRAWWRAQLLYLPLRHIYRRACKKNADLAEVSAQAMHAFDRAERADDALVDVPAAAFGEVIALLLSHGLDGNAKTVARHLGLHIGKWLYFADALDDYDEDVRLGRLNPLRRLYGDQPLTEDNRRAVAVAMGSELMQADHALALLDVDPDRCGQELLSLLTHMLQCALPRVTGALAEGTFRQKDRQHPRKDVRENDRSI